MTPKAHYTLSAPETPQSRTETPDLFVPVALRQREARRIERDIRRLLNHARFLKQVRRDLLKSLDEPF